MLETPTILKICQMKLNWKYSLMEFTRKQGRNTNPKTTWEKTLDKEIQDSRYSWKIKLFSKNALI